MPPSTTQPRASGPTQAQIELKNKITTLLNALKTKPAEQKNAEEAQKLVDAFKLPNAKTPVLYAIGGKAGLATTAQWGQILKNNKDPKVKPWCFSAKSSLMAGGQKPARPPAEKIQSQLAAYAYFPLSQKMNLAYAHEILIEFRLPPEYGGCGNVVRRAATVNDTGSNVQSIRRTDWNALNTYGITPMPGSLYTAAGPQEVQNVYMEIRVVTPEVTRNEQQQKVYTGRYLPLSIWFTECTRVVDGGDDEPLLSGEEMRKYLYFATEPGNQRLLVSERRQAIITGLEAIQPPNPGKH